MEVVRFLCEAGVDGNKGVKRWNKFTPLEAASMQGHLNVVQLLCSVGVDKDRGGPLHLAIERGDLDMVHTLCEDV